MQPSLFIRPVGFSLVAIGMACAPEPQLGGSGAVMSATSHDGATTDAETGGPGTSIGSATTLDSHGGGGATSSSTGSGPSGSTGAPGDPMQDPDDPAGSDPFDTPAPCELLPGWQLLSLTMFGVPGPHEVCDVGESHPGRLTIVAEPSGWYDDYWGAFVYQMAQGDFFIETSVIASSVASAAPPAQPYNSAGLLIRDPDGGPSTENWVLISVGFQDLQVGIEGKVTRESETFLETIGTDAHDLDLRLCRIGDRAILARRRPGEIGWVVSHEFDNTGLPDSVQVGVETTAWNSLGQHPDLLEAADLEAQFRYFRIEPVDSEEACLQP